MVRRISINDEQLNLYMDVGRFKERFRGLIKKGLLTIDREGTKKKFEGFDTNLGELKEEWEIFHDLYDNFVFVIRKNLYGEEYAYILKVISKYEKFVKVRIEVYGSEVNLTIPIYYFNFYRFDIGSKLYLKRNDENFLRWDRDVQKKKLVGIL